MNEIWDSYPALELFLSYAVKTSLLLGIVWGISALMRKMPAALRSNVWNAGIVTLLVLPALIGAIPSWNALAFIKHPPPETTLWMDEIQTTLSSAPPKAQRIKEVASPLSQIESSRQLTQHRDERSVWMPLNIVYILYSVWGGGIILLGFSLVRDHVRTRGLLARAWTVDFSKRLSEDFEGLVAAFAIRRPVRLLVSDEIKTPLTLGLWRPAVVLPTSTLSWSKARQKAIIMHELAHIDRFDTVTLYVAHLVGMMYWMNPLVWFAVKQLRYEQENACDDVVIQRGMHSVEYAEHLLAVARWSRERSEYRAGLVHPAHAVSMAQGHMLKKRVRVLLSGETNRRSVSSKHRLVFSAVVVALCFPLAALQIPARPGEFTYLWYEVEEGDVEGAMRIETDEKSSNYRYLLAFPEEETAEGDQDGFVTLRFKVPYTGYYMIWGRILAPSIHANSFYVSVDDGEPLLWDTRGPDDKRTAKVWSWDRVRQRASESKEEGGDPVSFYLKAGWHTLHVKAREKGTGIDKVLITDNPIYRPRSKGMPTERIDREYIWLEPEQGVLVPPMEIEDGANASGSQYIHASNAARGKGMVYLRFKVDHDDTYMIWGRILAPSQSDNSFFLSVDGSDELLWDLKGPDSDNTAKDWWWDHARDRESTREAETDSLLFQLEAGWHTLLIRNREDGAALDRVLITNDLSYNPEGWGTSPDELEPVYLWMEAEDAEISPPLQHGHDASASNGAFIEVSGEYQSLKRPPKNGFATFYVTVPVDGTYLLWSRVLAPKTGDSFWLRVDGKRWIRWNGIQRGEGWHWEEVHDNLYDNRVLSVELQAGVHVLEIAYREANTRLDGLLLTNDLNYVPATSLGDFFVPKREVLVSAFRN